MKIIETIEAGAASVGVDLPALEAGIAAEFKAIVERAQAELLTIAERTDIGEHLTTARSHLVSALLLVDAHLAVHEQQLQHAAHAVESMLTLDASEVIDHAIAFVAGDEASKGN